MGRVIYVLKKVVPSMTLKREVVPSMTLKRAARITWTAHSQGRAVAKTAHKELAELYEERLKAKGLTVSIEPGT